METHKPLPHLTFSINFWKFDFVAGDHPYGSKIQLGPGSPHGRLCKRYWEDFLYLSRGRIHFHVSQMQGCSDERRALHSGDAVDSAFIEFSLVFVFRIDFVMRFHLFMTFLYWYLVTAFVRIYLMNWTHILIHHCCLYWFLLIKLVQISNGFIGFYLTLTHDLISKVQLYSNVKIKST